MDYSSYGPLNAPIDCGTEREDGTSDMQMVTDLGLWIRNQLLHLCVLSAQFKKDRKPIDAKRKIWIGTFKKPFAMLTVSGSNLSVIYAHPAFMRKQGFVAIPDSFESTDVDEVVHDFVTKEAKVDPYNW